MHQNDRKIMRMLKRSAKINWVIDSILKDGGKGSGNFNHSGRPGQVGGSAPSGSGGGSSGSEGSSSSTESSSMAMSKSPQRVERNKRYCQSIDRDVSQCQDGTDKSFFLYKNGFMPDANEAYQLGQTEQIDSVFQNCVNAMKENGDPTPQKEARPNNQINQQVKLNGGNWDSARKSLINKYTGYEGEQLQEAKKQLQQWTSYGGWDKADTRTLDKYIQDDGVYDGQIWRGLSFSQNEYDEFMSSISVGSRIGMRGKNSSWSTDKETAYNFSNTNDRSVVLRCVKNRTSAPIDYINGMGQGQVIGHSKARWTVMNVTQGTRRTMITVMQTGDYDDDSGTHDAEPERRTNKNAYTLSERMRQQSKDFFVDNSRLK